MSSKSVSNVHDWLLDVGDREKDLILTPRGGIGISLRPELQKSRPERVPQHNVITVRIFHKGRQRIGCHNGMIFCRTFSVPPKVTNLARSKRRNCLSQWLGFWGGQPYRCPCSLTVTICLACLSIESIPELWNLSLHSLPEAWGPWERQHVSPALQYCIMLNPSLQLQKKTVWCREAKGGQVWYGLRREKIFIFFCTSIWQVQPNHAVCKPKEFHYDFRFVSPFTLKWTFPHLNDLVLLFNAHFLFSKSKHSQQFAISKWKKLLYVAKTCGQWKSHLETLHQKRGRKTPVLYLHLVFGIARRLQKRNWGPQPWIFASDYAKKTTNWIASSMGLVYFPTFNIKHQPFM